jgi:hypothetical protein
MWTASNTVRRWRDTKSAAVAATERAGLDRLEELAASHDRARAAAHRSADGDTTTTVGELLERVTQTPGYSKLAARTRDEYSYTLAQMMDHDHGTLGATLPRDMDIARVRGFLESFRRGARHQRSSASKGIAAQGNGSGHGARGHARHRQCGDRGARRDPEREGPAAQTSDRPTPTDEDVTAFWQALRSDPATGPMLGPRVAGPATARPAASSTVRTSPTCWL